MSFCGSIKRYAREHEWLADLSSLAAVILLFASIWAAIRFHTPLLEWIQSNVLLRTPALVGLLALDVALIFGLLCVGSSRCEDGNCFRTFRGRRHGSPSLFTAFNNWIRHIEEVGKRHR